MITKSPGKYLYEIVCCLSSKEANQFLKTLKKGTDVQRLFRLMQVQQEKNAKAYIEKEIAQAFGKPQSLAVVKKQLEERIEQWLMQQPPIGSDVGFMNHEMALIEQLVFRQLFSKAHQKIQHLKVIFYEAGRWTRLASLLQYESLFAEKFFEESELMPAVIKLSEETVSSLHKAANLAEYNRLNIQALSMMFNDTAKPEEHRSISLQMLSHPLLMEEQQALSFQAKMVRLGVTQMLYKLCGDEKRAIEIAYKNAVTCIAEAEGKLPVYVRANGMLNFLHLSEKDASSKEFEHIISELPKLNLAPEHLLIYELKFFIHRFFYHVAKQQSQQLDTLCTQTLSLIKKHEECLEPITLNIAYFYLGKWFALNGNYHKAYDYLVYATNGGLPQNYQSIYMNALAWKAVITALGKKTDFAAAELKAIAYNLQKDFAKMEVPEMLICKTLVKSVKKGEVNWSELHSSLLENFADEVLRQQTTEYHSVNLLVFIESIVAGKSYWKV